MVGYSGSDELETVERVYGKLLIQNTVGEVVDLEPRRSSYPLRLTGTVRVQKLLG